MARGNDDWRSRPDWQRSRFTAVREAFRPASQDGDTAPTLGRDIIEGAVRDPRPEGGDKRRIRLKVNCDILDRELAAGRIGDGQYAAGRTYQRLMDIAVGGANLLSGGGGNADPTTRRDDVMVRLVERAKRVDRELAALEAIVGRRAMMLLSQLLCERNLDTGKPWTIEELCLALYGAAPKHRVYAMAQRFREALEDMAQRWPRVSA